MIGNTFDTPIMHQDLANYSMSPMNLGMMGMPYANSNYLGGVRMQPQLDQDKLQVINKKSQESKNTLKNALTAIGVILAVGFVPVLAKNIKKAGGIGKFFSNQWNKLKNFFKGSSSAQPATPKKSVWQNVKNWFNNTASKVKGWFGNTAPKVKGWFGNVATKVKGFFKKSTPATPSTSLTP